MVVRQTPQVPVIPPPFQVQRLAGGFRVSRDRAVKPTPAICNVAVAYDTSRSGALHHYNTSDFTLDAIKIKIDHGKVRTKGDNTLTVDVKDDDFELTVTGFDLNRDLFIDVEKD